MILPLQEHIGPDGMDLKENGFKESDFGSTHHKISILPS